MTKKKSILSTWHVGVAAEAIAAGQFARLGYDISVQYGADQPEYDLVISKGKNDLPIRVSVKGTQKEGWGLTQRYLEKGKADYQKAIDKWLKAHGRKTIFCFVQFKGVKQDELPRIYLATPRQVAKQLRKVGKGKGGTILYENYEWKQKTAVGYGTKEKLPTDWKFSSRRIEEISK